MLEYKGYHADIVYDEENDYYSGLLYGIHDLVTFCGETQEEAEKDFYDAVEEYLEFCKEIDKEPDREVAEDLNLRVNDDLYKNLKDDAQKAEEGLNSFVEKILNNYIAKTA